MITISVLNKKGGVGKSVVALNLAYELQRKGNRLLFIDLDPQADATKILQAHFQPKKSTSPAGIYDVMIGNVKATQVIREISKHLHFIPGILDLIHFDLKHSSKKLADTLTNKKIKKAYDFVIIDHPPSLNEIALAGIIASNNLIFVTEP